MKLDRLYLITSRHWNDGDKLPTQIEESIQNGVGIV